MQEVDPRVSTDLKLLTNTILVAISLAVKTKKTVMVVRSPSGRLVKIISMMKTSISTISYSMTIRPYRKKVSASMAATVEIRMTTRSISYERGICLVLAEEFRLLILLKLVY